MPGQGHYRPGEEKEQAMSNNHTGGSKSNLLKLVKSPAATLRLGGLAPSADMAPGEYIAICENAWADEQRKDKPIRIIWQFRIFEGEHTGVTLRKWMFPADQSGEVSPLGYYAKYCAIALGRQLQVSDNLNDAGAIFKGKIFRVSVGYRKTLRPKGGTYSDRNTLIRKDDQDRLRVHDILALVEL